jgi:hypothetical protein
MSLRTQHQRERRQYRISTNGSIALVLIGFGILITHGTPYQRLWGLLAFLLGGGIIYGITRIVDEQWQGGILPYTYSGGLATVGLLEFSITSVHVAVVAVLSSVGVIVFWHAIERWNAPISGLIGASLGVVATGLALYVL